MKWMALLLVMSVQTVAAGLAQYSTLVVADNRDAIIDSGRIRVTYLGTNGYQFETAGHAILVDPYFSRLSLSRLGFGWHVDPDRERVDEALQHLRRKIDAILVTHGHVDHLLDAPVIMDKTHARLIASPVAIELARRAGASSAACDAVRPGNVTRLGPWTITVLPATHDRIFLMGVPFNGPLKKNGRPVTASDWICGEPLSYLIEANGTRIFIDSGGTPASLPPSSIAPVDLAILGVALSDARVRFANAVRRLRPRFLLPSHQDNFFAPLDRGFHFGRLTDFPRVLRDYHRERLPGRLILLNYFQAWTIPKK